jgi:hypothetical protein
MMRNNSRGRVCPKREKRKPKGGLRPGANTNRPVEIIHTRFSAELRGEGKFPEGMIVSAR